MPIHLPSDHREPARRWFELVWNKQQREKIDEMMWPDVIVHGLGEDRIGPAAFHEFHEMFLGAFPDIHVQFDSAGKVQALRTTG